jgi:DNA replication and repair protein RecF
LLALQHYRAALVRRNAVLRALQREGGRATAASVDKVSVWEPALAHHGGVVAALRHRFVCGHAQAFADIGAAIGERAPVSMRYMSSSSGAAEVVEAHDDAVVANAGDGTAADAKSQAAAQSRALRAAFEQQRTQEVRRGVTLVGPHRDELQLLIAGRELRTFGSAGQQRSAAIALRLLELATLRAAIGRTPLLLLDDPFAELDSGRAARVLSLLEASGVGQVLLAVPRIEDIPDAFTRLERRTMRDGAVA